MKWTKEIVVTIIIAVLSLIISGYSEYSHNDKETAVKIQAIETQQKADDESFRELKQDVREIRTDVRDLVKWARGK